VTDPNLRTSAPVTLQSETVIVGLAAGARDSFRVRGRTRTGEGNESQVLSSTAA
jgi:hypothetical protein